MTEAVLYYNWNQNFLAYGIFNDYYYPENLVQLDDNDLNYIDTDSEIFTYHPGDEFESHPVFIRTSGGELDNWAILTTTENGTLQIKLASDWSVQNEPIIIVERLKIPDLINGRQEYYYDELTLPQFNPRVLSTLYNLRDSKLTINPLIRPRFSRGM